MFSESMRKRLLAAFEAPLRPAAFRELAEQQMRRTRYRSLPGFLKALEEAGIVRPESLKVRNGKRVTLYSARPLEEFTSYELAFAMFPEGYFCNATAIFHHSLTNQVPNVVYICHPTISPRPRRRTEGLSEVRIRTAFIKPHVYTTHVVVMKDSEVVVVDRERGADHGLLTIRTKGSVCPQGARVTSLERALIDAVVAPHYNGGVASLPGYFKAARPKLNVQRLLELYEKLDFVYPYAQAIGFFLEHAGMAEKAEEIRKAYPPRQRFFVDHAAKSSWLYDDRWMIHYPEGLVDDR